MTPFSTSSIALFTPHTSRAPTPATRTTETRAHPRATFFLLLMMGAYSFGSERFMSAPPSPAAPSRICPRKSRPAATDVASSRPTGEAPSPYGSTPARRKPPSGEGPLCTMPPTSRARSPSPASPWPPLIAGGPEGAPSGTGALATSTTRLSGS